MFKNLEVVLEEKKENYYKDLSALSRFRESTKKESTNDEKGFDYFELITDLGFTNSSMIRERNEIISKNRNFNQAVSQACDSLEFIKAISEYFGKGTILVKRDDFIHIIRKYGLACGNFEEYTGIVPDENLLEINDARVKLEQIHDPGFGGSYTNFVLKNAYKPVTVELDDIIYEDRDEPLSKAARKYLCSFPIILISSTSGSRSAEAAMIKKYLADYLPEDQLRKINWCRTHLVSNSGMFIAAPREKMKNAEKSIRFMPAPKDPFICSLVPYGVVIHSRWGKEAEDETLNKYDNLFNRLRGA